MSYNEITFKTKAINGEPSKTAKFFSWVGRPNLKQPVVEVVTRKGASSPVVQKIREESVETQSTALIKAVSTEKLEPLIKELLSLVGTPGVWTDERGNKIDDYIITRINGYTITEKADSVLAVISLSGVVG